MTQYEQIKNHLISYGHVDTWTAIQVYKITRLSQFILLLRKDGFQIEDEWQHKDGKRWVKYILIAVPDKTGQACLV